MSYFEIKTIKGNEYLYLRQSIRMGKRVIHKHIGYFGRVGGGRVTGSSGSSQTIPQVKREYQPKREPIKEPISKPEEKIEVPKKEKKYKIKIEPVELSFGKVSDERGITGKVKIDRSKEYQDKDKLLRKKKKKLKKFLRKKKLQEEEDKETKKEKDINPFGWM